MNTKAASPLSAKLIACVAAVAFLLFGVAGLFLPFIPGLLLLFFAAVIVAKNFPSIDGWLRKRPTLSRHMEWADAFYDLPLGEKARLCGWVCAKVTVDSLALLGSVAIRVWTAAVGAFRAREGA